MKDSYYTPAYLADYLVSLVKKTNITTVADFCVGEGDLLKAAYRKWKCASFYGTDISKSVITLMQKQNSLWHFGICDFLNSNSRKQSKILKQKFDLILLNPPFTCKGSTVKNILFDGQQYKMSTAMAFLVEAINYMKDDGVIYSILPQSIAYSTKDEKIRHYLQEKYSLKIIDEINKQGFKSCSPNIVLVSVNHKEDDYSVNSNNKIKVSISNLSFQRGNISMHEIELDPTSNTYLVHSTNMRENTLKDLKYRCKQGRSTIQGPALLIHRVGSPNPTKLCLINSDEIFVLSDCVIGIKTDTQKDSIELKSKILSNWNDFQNLYKGTGAKYITIQRLKDFLE